MSKIHVVMFYSYDIDKEDTVAWPVMAFYDGKEAELFAERAKEDTLKALKNIKSISTRSNVDPTLATKKPFLYALDEGEIEYYCETVEINSTPDMEL